MRKVDLDLHTHTIASGHAYGTLTEMARAAGESGLKIFGIVEHTPGIPGACDTIYFRNLKVVPREMFGLRLLLGAEINILDYDGGLSLDQRHIDCLDLRIAGIHEPCYPIGAIEDNTRAVIGAIRNPSIDIICHPDDGKCPLDYEQVVRAAREYHTLLEINNNSLRHPENRLRVKENSLALLTLCRQYGIPVILGSDAHYMNDIANMDQIEPLLAQIDFPERLIMNYQPEALLDWLADNRKAQ